jgi:hypothetical protein
MLLLKKNNGLPHILVLQEQAVAAVTAPSARIPDPMRDLLSSILNGSVNQN